MKLHLTLTVDQEAFIHAGIKAGRFRTPEEAAQEAVRQWEERERARAELQADIDEAMDDVQTGRFTSYGADLSSLMNDIRKEGGRLLEQKNSWPE